jgi:hypothetical protein
MPHIKLDIALPLVTINSGTEDHGRDLASCMSGEKGPLREVIALGLHQKPTQYVSVVLARRHRAAIDGGVEELVVLGGLEHIHTTRTDLTLGSACGI